MKQTYLMIEVNDRKSFTRFLGLLLADFLQNGKEWENNHLASFLEAMQAYSEDLDGFYKNVYPNQDPEVATWKAFADILKGAVVYE